MRTAAVSIDFVPQLFLRVNVHFQSHKQFHMSNICIAIAYCWLIVTQFVSLVSFSILAEAFSKAYYNEACFCTIFCKVVSNVKTFWSIFLAVQQIY